MQRDTLEKHPLSVIVKMDDQKNREQEQDTRTPEGEMQDVYVLIVRQREEEDAPFIVETTPLPSQKISYLPAYVFCGLYFLSILAVLVFQLYCIVNPPIATVTIVPKTHHFILSGSVHLGRLLQPLTISQSQTVPTTGRGHQDARAATGTVTFYNGQQTSQTIAQGTVFTGQSGVSIQTTQQATIPPGNPGTGYGTITVSAQALQAGSRSNIQAGDVNTPIALAVFVKNNQFSGGQDERTYTTVTQEDIHSISTVLKTMIARVSTGALQGQLQPDERLQLLPCIPHVTSNHQVGEEATVVTVTVSQTCSATAYNSQIVNEKVTTLLAERAQQAIGSGYSLFGAVNVSVKEAIVTGTQHPLVFLLFSAEGSWIYALDRSEQLHIKSLIAGKSTPKAMLLVESLSGVAHAAIHFAGIGDPERVPKNTQDIHLVLLVV